MSTADVNGSRGRFESLHTPVDKSRSKSQSGFKSPRQLSREMTDVASSPTRRGRHGRTNSAAQLTKTDANKVVNDINGVKSPISRRKSGADLRDASSDKSHRLRPSKSFEKPPWNSSFQADAPPPLPPLNRRVTYNPKYAPPVPEFLGKAKPAVVPVNRVPLTEQPLRRPLTAEEEAERLRKLQLEKEEEKPKFWKLKQFENVAPRVNTKENVNYSPGGGNIAVPETKKIDLSHITPRVSTKNELLSGAGVRNSKVVHDGHDSIDSNPRGSSSHSNEGADYFVRRSSGGTVGTPKAQTLAKTSSASSGTRRNTTLNSSPVVPSPSMARRSTAAPPIPPKSSQRGRSTKDSTGNQSKSSAKDIGRNSTGASRTSAKSSSQGSRTRDADKRMSSYTVSTSEEDRLIRLAVEAAEDRARYEAEVEESLADFGTGLTLDERCVTNGSHH